MAARQAKVSIGLDYKSLRQDVREAKKQLGDIGNAKIDPGLQTKLKGIFARDLFQQTENYKKKIGEVTSELRKMGQAGAVAADTKSLERMLRLLSQYQSALRSTRQQMRPEQGIPPASIAPTPPAGGGPPQTARPRQPQFIRQAPASSYSEGEEGGGGGGSFSGGGGGGSRFSPFRAFSGIKGAAATLGIGLGVSAALARSEDRARAGLQVRQLTGGASDGGSSSLGFTDMERRQRALEIASQSGKDMGQPEITRRVDQSERLERAYGISGSQYAGALGTARKAGIGDNEKFIANSVGDAVAMKLSGSAIGEYLSAMTQYLAGISKGVDVKETSLRGFAASLGSLEFFKRDPERIFDALSKMEKLFQGGGDEFQNFSTYGALEQAGGGAANVGPAGVAVRRSLGLFGGGGGLGDRARSAGMDDLGKTVDIDGEEALNKFLSNAFKTATAGGRIGGKNGKVDNNVAASLFQSITGMNDQSGIETYIAMANNQKNGGGATLPKGAKQAYQKSMQSPDERMKAVMANFDGSVVNFAKRVDDLKNNVSDKITTGVISLVNAVDDFAKDVGLFGTDVEKFATAVALIAGTQGGMSLAGNALGGAAGGAVSGLLAGGEGAAAAGVGMRAIGFLGVGGAVVGAAAAGFLIGEGIRSELNKWTKGEWDESVGKFWNKIRKALGMESESDKNIEGLDAARAMDKLNDQYGEENVSKDAQFATRANGKEGFMMDPTRSAKEIKADMEYKTDREKNYKEAGIDQQQSGVEIDKELKDKSETRARKLAKDARGRAEYDMLKAGQIEEGQLSDAGKEALAISNLPAGKRDFEERYGGLDLLPKAKRKLFKSMGIDPDSALGKLQPVTADDLEDPAYASGGKVLAFRRGFEDGGEVPRPDIKDFGGSWTNEFDKAYKLWKQGKDWRKGNNDLRGGIAAGLSKMLGRAGGGPIGHNSVMGYRSGGSAMGTDKIDAKLTAGEFVVNARSSSENMMALVHANAGGRIRAAAGGGLMGVMRGFSDGGEASTDEWGTAVPPTSTTSPNARDKLKIDDSMLQAALSGNTRALMELAQALSGAGGGSSPTSRPMPRGASGARYG